MTDGASAETDGASAGKSDGAASAETDGASAGKTDGAGEARSIFLSFMSGWHEYSFAILA